MYIKIEMNFEQLKRNSWSGAVDTLTTIQEHQKEDELMSWLEMYFEGTTPTETEVNDLLWFEDELIFADLGIETE